MNIDLSLFPKLPDYHAQGAPIFLEPIIGSGERVCVAVAARGDDAAFQVLPVIQPSTANRMLGDNGAKLINLLDLGINSLKRHLALGEQFQTWQSPIGGMKLGEIIDGQVSDLNMMMRTVARNHAFLANIADFRAADAPEDEESASERWLSQVREATSVLNPLLDGYFSRQVRLTPHSAPTRIDFHGIRFAAQLSRILPGGALSGFVTKAKAKLWDLEALRELCVSKSVSPESYELILFRPTDDDPNYSENQIRRLNEALNELEEAGDKQSLRVRPVYSAEEAADRIVAAEAA